MPKILHAPEQSILSAAQNELREKGVRGFNIRDVASLSGVAIGTIYNYYGHKFDLIAIVLKSFYIEDAKKIAASIPVGLTLEEGVAHIHHSIKEFKEKYSEAFESSLENGASPEYLFLDGVNLIIEKILLSANKTYGEEERKYVAESILWGATKDLVSLGLLQKIASYLAK